MNSRQYYYLVTIAGFGNLSHAAQALHVSQPALSKFLLGCEQELGVTLFLRHHGQLMPTAVGRYVIDHAQKILDEQNRMLLTMRTVAGQEHTNIRLATAPNRAAIIYSKVYNQFSRRFPDISLQLTELFASEQPQAISRGRIDLAIGAGGESDLVTDIPIVTEELLVSLPVSHPLASRESIRLADLRDTPFVLQGKQHSIRILAEKLFREAGFEPVVAFESADVLLLDSMMHQAVGAGLVSKAHVFPCDELVYRPLDPPVYQTLHIRYPLGHTLTEPERYLASLLIRERLGDPRYTAIHSPEADALYAVAGEAEESRAPAGATGAAGAQQVYQPSWEVSLDRQVLEYLIAIVEEHSLSAAAERFYLAQPALSRHLRNVERMVDTTLFTRAHNRLAPTNAGKVFVNNARNMLHIEDELYSYVQAYRGGHGGGLYLNCDPALLPLLQARVVPAFAAQHPDVQLHLQESGREATQEALLGASCDLGVYLSVKPDHPLMDCRVLALTELVYCADREAPLPQDSLPAIPAGRRLMLSPAGTTLRSEQDRLLEAYGGAEVQIVCEAQFPILRRLVQAGGADTILPMHLLAREHYAHCRPFEPPQPFYLVLAWHASRHLPPPARDLTDRIAEACRDALDLPPAPARQAKEA